MADSAIHRPVHDFSPSTPAVTTDSIAAVLADHSLVIVHFWAVWNGADPVMDARLSHINDLLPSTAHFASCNIDDPECADLAKSVGVVNVPWLTVFANGKNHGHICGLRKPDQLASTLIAMIEHPECKQSWWRFW